MHEPKLLTGQFDKATGRAPVVPRPCALSAHHEWSSGQSFLLAARLREAENRVSRGKQVVARQRECVASIARPPVPSATALLNTYEKSLTLFEEDFAVVHADIIRHQQQQ